jgi:hypothetical protein
MKCGGEGAYKQGVAVTLAVKVELASLTCSSLIHVHTS